MKNLIKTIPKILILFLLLSDIFAEVPDSINYQGRYFENGEPVTGTRDCYFKITNADGTTVYYSTGPITLNFYNGLFNYQIPCSTVVWNNPPSGGYYLQVEIGGNVIGREKILAVPYSFYATSATYAGPFNENLIVDSFIDLKEIATPANPLADRGRLFARDNAGATALVWRTSDGNEVVISTTQASISGSGTTNRVAKFTSGNTIGNSSITDDGTNVDFTSSGWTRIRWTTHRHRYCDSSRHRIFSWRVNFCYYGRQSRYWDNKSCRDIKRGW
jgi:hypothetical protein